MLQTWLHVKLSYTVAGMPYYAHALKKLFFNGIDKG